MNLDKIEFMCFNPGGASSSLNSKPLKLVDQFIYFDSNISSNESDVNICISKYDYWENINHMKIWSLTK